jgi:hypothetical protein
MAPDSCRYAFQHPVLACYLGFGASRCRPATVARHSRRSPALVRPGRASAFGSRRVRSASDAVSRPVKLTQGSSPSGGGRSLSAPAPSRCRGRVPTKTSRDGRRGLPEPHSTPAGEGVGDRQRPDRLSDLRGAARGGPRGVFLACGRAAWAPRRPGGRAARTSGCRIACSSVRTCSDIEQLFRRSPCASELVSTGLRSTGNS